MFRKLFNKKAVTGINSRNGIKDEYFDFDLISYYFNNRDDLSPLEKINARTINDIDFYQLFSYLDRTCSKIGQQYLFRKLLTIEKEVDFTEQEELISYLRANEPVRLKVQSFLSKLNKTEAYYIPYLFLDKYIDRPSWFWAIKLLSVLTVVTIVLTIFIHQFFILLMLLSLTNLFIHYWNKRNIYLYNDSITQMLSLCKYSNELIQLNLPVKSHQRVVDSIQSLEKLRSRLSVFSMESKFQSEIIALLLLVWEYFKIFTLMEPLFVFGALKRLDTKRKEIQILFEYFGSIDSALAIDSLREQLPVWCSPTITIEPTAIEFEEIYHPLIPDCVSNSMRVNKSVLLTGSNMAGKTTFIRTIAINMLLGQTINTCFAKQYRLSPMRLFSAIRISDDLFNDKSYYFEEVLTIKTMVDESNSSIPNLFLLDEIFKGTNTIERIAAGKAVLSYIAGFKQNIVFVSTHDIELTELLKDSYDLYHFTELIENGQIQFDYKLKQGPLTTKNAIRILELNDYPKCVIDDAKAVSCSISEH